MTQEMFEIIFGVIICLLMVVAVWESCKMISEKKERQRKGLTDYHDNPIKKNNCMGGEDN